jgi:hypothetical protein
VEKGSGKVAFRVTGPWRVYTQWWQLYKTNRRPWLFRTRSQGEHRDLRPGVEAGTDQVAQAAVAVELASVGQVDGGRGQVRYTGGLTFAVK